MNLERRKRMAAESILENESLREGLDDEAASILLNWGIACAQQIASRTASLDDEIEAEEAMYPHMRALRQMLRAAVALCGETSDQAQQDALFDEIVQSIPAVYGPTASVPEKTAWAAAFGIQPASCAQRISALRNLLENNNPLP